MREQYNVLRAKHFKHECERTTRVMRDFKHTCEENAYFCYTNSFLQIHSHFMEFVILIFTGYSMEIFYPLDSRTNPFEGRENDTSAVREAPIDEGVVQKLNVDLFKMSPSPAMQARVKRFNEALNGSVQDIQREELHRRHDTDNPRMIHICKVEQVNNMG